MPPFVKADVRHNRTKLRPRIVHIGFGAFHRAHQALFTDQVARQGDSDWGICEVSLFNDTAIAALRAQDHMFSVLETGAESTEIKIVQAATCALTPSLDGPEAVIAQLAAAETAIISLTITEKGYCIDPATGRLDMSHPEILSDLKGSNTPQTVLGYLTAALKKRRELGHPPLSILSCDNIQGNGQVAKAALLAFARQTAPDLADWINAKITFPCTMVDRIVPAVTDDTAADIAAHLGHPDPCGVACEPFKQWVIEDNFAAGRPDWDIAGAKFVADVTPYEEMKLRMLNGAHSFLAYLGYLAGYTHISDTMDDPHFRSAAFDLMTQEAAPSLTMPAGADLRAYAEQLIVRFSNPALKHKTWQIAMDGSQKIPHRLGGSLKHHLAQGTDFPMIALGIAAWMRYVSGMDEQGHSIDICDPLAAELYKRANQPDPVASLLGMEAIFEPEIGRNSDVITKVTQAYNALLQHGAKAALAAL
ncbi:MAG: fructuronate reductase [Pseudomonadota bacterium]